MGDPCPLPSPPRGFYMDSLRLQVLTPHHYDTGCHCKECFSLVEFMHEHTGRTYALPERSLVPLPVVVSACDGSLVCDCPDCVRERSERVSRPPKAHPQPWEAKAA